MGVDFYNCNVCDEIYADYSNYGTCEGCDARWCENCDENIKKFIYDGKECCNVCFSTDPVIITDDEMLDHVLQMLEKTRDDLKREMLLMDMYNKPQNEYKCIDPDGKHECNNACLVIAEDFDLEESQLPLRGLCCVARYKEDKDAYCAECTKDKKLKPAEFL